MVEVFGQLSDTDQRWQGTAEPLGSQGGVDLPFDGRPEDLRGRQIDAPFREWITFQKGQEIGDLFGVQAD